MTDSTRPRLRGKKAAAFVSLNAVLKSHVRRSADGRKAVGHATIRDRSLFFDKMIRDLHGLGYELRDIRNFKPKHIRALAAHWEAQALSGSTLQKRFAYLRLLCRWIGKPGMLGDAASYLKDPERYRRSYAAQYDHSWTAQGVEPLDVLARVVAKDPNVARVLCLQLAFGLRLQEASLLRPSRDDLGDLLRVVAGTKGGRARAVPIETATQRAILDEARAITERTERRSQIPLEYDLRQWLNRCYTVFRACGITRAEGVVSHGARHQYANDLYEQLTGTPSPVRGGGDPDAQTARAARLAVSSRLGHARESITTAYFGKVTTGRQQVATRTATAQWEAALREQRRLLHARVKPHIVHRQRAGRDGRTRISDTTLVNRTRLLNQWLRDWACAGCPLETPEQLSGAHIDALLELWHRDRALGVHTIRNRCQFLAQVCGWLGRPELAARVKAGWEGTKVEP